MAVILTKSAPNWSHYTTCDPNLDQGVNQYRSRSSEGVRSRTGGHNKDEMDFSAFRRLFVENMKQNGGPTLSMRMGGNQPPMAHTLPMTHR